jgi:ABC-type uncharacterized transport system auxiliary subunit
MIRRNVWLLPVLLLAGCLTAPEIVPVRYFAVDPVMNITPAEGSGLTLGVRPLVVARPYKSAMAYRSPSLEIGYRVNEEWAENPGDIVTRAVSDAMVALKRFRDAGNAGDMARPDLIMTGDLRKFVENRETSPGAAEIEVRLELREARGNGALWSATLSAKAPMEGDRARDLAAAMSRAVGRIAEMVAEAVGKLELPAPADAKP